MALQQSAPLPPGYDFSRPEDWMYGYPEITVNNTFLNVETEVIIYNNYIF